MEITARLTRDAKLFTLNDERQAVNFNVAVNDSYKTKDKELKKVTTYFNVAIGLIRALLNILPKAHWLRCTDALVLLLIRIWRENQKPH